MLTRSAKAKGKKLEKKVAKLICDKFNLVPNVDVSVPYGVQPGADIKLITAKAIACFPFHVECKNHESWDLNTKKLWEGHPMPLLANAFAQIGTKRDQYGYLELKELIPIVVFSKNRGPILVAFPVLDMLYSVQSSFVHRRGLHDREFTMPYDECSQIPRTGARGLVGCRHSGTPQVQLTVTIKDMEYCIVTFQYFLDKVGE